MGGHKLMVSAMLGAGSFGKVWSAVDRKGKEVVIKEVLCASKKQLELVISEADVVKTMGASRDCRLPSLIGISAKKVDEGKGGWRVWVAMTRLPGQQVDHFLKSQRTLIASNRREKVHQVADAISMARVMLTQLAPVFQRINRHFYHRDATARNILIDGGDGVKPPTFSVVDFGLAVDSEHWQAPDPDPRSTTDDEAATGSAETVLAAEDAGAQDGVGNDGRVSRAASGWRHRGVAGDGRYWPTSAWLLFEFNSPVELLAFPELCWEYQRRLDIHSVGVVALQVLVDMFPQVDDSFVTDSSVLLKVGNLQRSWEIYWSDVSALWRGIFDGMQKQQLEQLRAEYRKAEVHKRVRRNLESLRLAICGLRRVCASGERAGARDNEIGHLGVGSVALMDALLVMIGRGDSIRSGDDWQFVQDILAGDRSAPQQPEEDPLPGNAFVSSSTLALGSSSGSLVSVTPFKRSSSRTASASALPRHARALVKMPSALEQPAGRHCHDNSIVSLQSDVVSIIE